MADRVPPDIHPQWFQLEQVFANAPIGLVLLDRELRYLRVNRALADMVRMNQEDMLGKTVAELLKPPTS